MVSRKSNIRKYSADAATVAKQVAGLLPSNTAFEKRSRSLDAKQRKAPPVARKPLLSSLRRSSTTKSSKTPKDAPVKTPTMVKTDITNNKTSPKNKTDTKPPSSTASVDSTDSTTFMSMKIVDDNVFQEPTKSSNFSSSKANEVVTTTTKIPNNTRGKSEDKKMEKKEKKTPSSPGEKKVDEMVRLLNQTNKNNDERDKNRKRENSTSSTSSTTTISTTNEEPRNDTPKKQIIVEDVPAVESKTIRQLDSLPTKLSDNNNNNNNENMITKQQQKLCEEPLLEEHVRTALTICHLEDEESLLGKKEVIVNVPKSLLRNNQDIERDNNKKNRDSWDILVDEPVIIPHSQSTTNKKLEIESGLLLQRQTSTDKEDNNNNDKHHSWNILDLKQQKDDDLVDEWLLRTGSLGNRPQDKKKTTTDVSYRSGSLGSKPQHHHNNNNNNNTDISDLFEKYQRERKALRKLQDKKDKKRWSVGSMSDFSDISSISDEDDRDDLDDWHQNVSDVDDPETSYLKAFDKSRSQQHDPKTSHHQQQQQQQQTKNTPTTTSKPTNSKGIKAEIINYGYTPKTTEQPHQEPAVMRRNKRNTSNNDDNNQTEQPKTPLSPKTNLRGSVEETKIKPLPEPVKPDFVPQVSTFSEEDLGSMVMAQAVSAVRKRRGGRARRNVNAEIEQQQQKQETTTPAQPQPSIDLKLPLSSLDAKDSPYVEDEEENPPKVPERPPSPVIKDLINKRISPRPQQTSKQQQTIQMSKEPIIDPPKLVVPLSQENVLNLLDNNMPSEVVIRRRGDDSSSTNSTSNTVKSSSSGTPAAAVPVTQQHPRNQHQQPQQQHQQPKHQQQQQQQQTSPRKPHQHSSSPRLHTTTSFKTKPSGPHHHHHPNRGLHHHHHDFLGGSSAFSAIPNNKNARSYDYVNSMPNLYQYNSNNKLASGDIEYGCDGSDELNNSDTSLLMSDMSGMNC